jgi:stage II sporulation protein M
MAKKRKKNVKKKNFFKDNYMKSWEFLKDSSNFIWVIVGIFVFFALIGFFVPAPASIAEQIMKIIQEILELTEGMSMGELINFIFWNNLKVSFIGMVSGILLGIIPVLESMVNGYLLGFVASKTVLIDGFMSLWRIFPHGIFELPAVFISLALGLRMGMYFFQKKQREMRSFKNTILESLRLFIFIIIPLLIIAAVIEGLLVFVLA